MRIFAFFLLFIFCAFSEGDLKPVKKLPLAGVQFTTDPMGNLYVMKNERIDKYDRDGNLQRSFSDKTAGEISSVDATNLLRIVLFYRNFSQVAFLDNTMSLNGSPVRLQDLGFAQATLVCNSYDNALWLYDQQNFELVRLQNNLQVSHRTGNLAQQLNVELQPAFLLESGNRLFLNNPSTGILVFDVFGTYYKTIPVKGLKNFQVNGDVIFYFANGGLNSYHLGTQEEGKLALADSTLRAVRMEKERLYFQRDSTIEIYQSGN
ncbi:MAG: hypothetical protein FD123_2882 [Bacteroidetes bacterium]|nr:MAG: hypothetical protein FD123_2882 [Bacteroidota bacterium]